MEYCYTFENVQCNCDSAVKGIDTDTLFSIIKHEILVQCIPGPMMLYLSPDGGIQAIWPQKLNRFI